MPIKLSRRQHEMVFYLQMELINLTLPEFLKLVVLLWQKPYLKLFVQNLQYMMAILIN